MLRNRTRILIALASFGVVAVVATVVSADDLLVPRTFRITHSGNLTPSQTCASVTEPEEVLTVTRGVLQLDMEVSVNATLTIRKVGVLRSFKFKVGTDADNDHVIESSEWETIATGNISESGGVTTATIDPVDVGIDGHVYRMEQDRTDEGIVWEEHIVDSSYTTSDWVWVE
jgi:hypothetical protein